MSFEDFKQYNWNKDTFCPHPWISFYPSPRGDVFPCCVSMKYRPPGKVDPDGDIDKMMNSTDFNTMRLKMMNGERPKECGDCWLREDSGVRSDRVSMLRRWTYDPETHGMGQEKGRKKYETLLKDAIDRTNPDGSINDFKMYYLEYRDNNICNYKCRFCNVNSSNTWVKEWKALGRMGSAPFNINAKTGVAQSGVQWDKMDLTHLTNIHMAGGEPTAMDSTYWLLEHLIEIDRAKEIEIGIVSNTSRLVYKKKNILDLLSHFKFVNWSVSADAMGKAHDLLRAGGLDDWDKVKANILEIRDWADHPERSMKFHSTMNWSNAFQWWDMKRELDIDSDKPIDIQVYFSTGPDGHGLNDLPTAQLKRIQDFYKNKSNYANKEVTQILAMCEKWMPKNEKQEEQRQVHMSRFKEEQIYFDRSRGQIWTDVFPEWADFFKSIQLPTKVRDSAINMQDMVKQQIAEFPGKYF